MSFKSMSKYLQLSTTEKPRQKLRMKKKTNKPELKSKNSPYFYTSGSFILDSNTIIYNLARVTRVLRASCAGRRSNWDQRHQELGKSQSHNLLTSNLIFINTNEESFIKLNQSLIIHVKTSNKTLNVKTLANRRRVM